VRGLALATYQRRYPASTYAVDAMIVGVDEPACQLELVAIGCGL
jgi:hypothetical protein